MFVGRQLAPSGAEAGAGEALPRVAEAIHVHDREVDPLHRRRRPGLAADHGEGAVGGEEELAERLVLAQVFAGGADDLSLQQGYRAAAGDSDPAAHRLHADDLEERGKADVREVAAEHLGVVGLRELVDEGDVCQCHILQS